MFINDKVAADFKKKHGAVALRTVMANFGVVKATASPGRISAVMTDLEITSLKRANDISVVAAAAEHGLRIVSGDTKVSSAAVRRRWTYPRQLAARQFDNAMAFRVRWCQKNAWLFGMWLSATADAS